MYLILFYHLKSDLPIVRDTPCIVSPPPLTVFTYSNCYNAELSTNNLGG